MKSQKPKVTVVTLNYNGKHLLDKHYTSLMNQSYTNVDFIFVENGSSDDSEKFIKYTFPKVKIVKIKDNVGPVNGYIRGADAAATDSKYIVICGNDTWFDRDWLKEQVLLMESDEKNGICGANQMNYKGNAQINKGGIPLDIFGYPTSGNKGFFYVDGVSLMIKRDLYKKLGGYDEKFWVYVEEVDLAWRARLLGYNVVVAETAIFYHKGGATLDKVKVTDSAHTTTPQKRFLAEKNTLRMLLKNYSVVTLVYVLPIFFVLNFLEGLAFIILGKPRLIQSHFAAWLWNVKNFKNTMKKRREIQYNRIVSDTEIQKHMFKEWGKLKGIKWLGGIPNVS